MIKHIVFWKMKKKATDKEMYRDIEIAAEKLDAVAKQFPAIKSLTHNTCIFSGGHYWDYVEEMVFEDLDSLKEWAKFPPHKELHDFVESIREERAAVDYEMK